MSNRARRATTRCLVQEYKLRLKAWLCVVLSNIGERFSDGELDRMVREEWTNPQWRTFVKVDPNNQALCRLFAQIIKS